MGPDKGSTTPTIINNADGMFHSTKIINNAPFPQIVIIKQRQGKSNGDRPNNTQRQQLRALGIHRDKLLEALMENPQRQQEMLKQISDVFDAPRGQKAILKELDTLLREEKMLDTPREEKMLDTPRKTKELNNPRKEKELEKRIEQLENAVNHQQAVLKNIGKSNLVGQREIGKTEKIFFLYPPSFLGIYNSSPFGRFVECSGRFVEDPGKFEEYPGKFEEYPGRFVEYQYRFVEDPGRFFLKTMIG